MITTTEKLDQFTYTIATDKGKCKLCGKESGTVMCINCQSLLTGPDNIKFIRAVIREQSV